MNFIDKTNNVLFKFCNDANIYNNLYYYLKNTQRIMINAFTNRLQNVLVFLHSFKIYSKILTSVTIGFNQTIFNIKKDLMFKWLHIYHNYVILYHNTLSNTCNLIFVIVTQYFVLILEINIIFIIYYTWVAIFQFFTNVKLFCSPNVLLLD